MSNIELNVVALGNFKGLESQLASLQAQINSMNASLASGNASLTAKQMTGLSNAFHQSMMASGQFTSKLVSMSTAAQHLGERIQKSKTNMADYRNAMKKVSDQSNIYNQLAQRQVGMQQAIVQSMGGGMARVYAQHNVDLSEASIRSKVFTQAIVAQNTALMQGATKIINWGKNMQWAGRQLTAGLTMPVTLFAGALAKMYNDVDANLTRLARVYGVGLEKPTQSMLAGVRRDVIGLAKELGHELGISATEVSDTAAQFAAAGLTGEQLIGATKQASRMVVLGETDKQSAIKATIALQTAYKLNTEQVTEATNFFNAAQAATSTSMTDLVEAIPRVGPIIQGLGGSYKDMVAILTALKEGGVPAGEAANAIKNSLGRIVNPTKAAQNKLKGFGIDINSIVNKNAGNLIGTLTDLQSGLDKLSSLDRQRAIAELFGKFQFARMAAFMDNFNKTGTQSAKVVEMMGMSAAQLAGIADDQTKQIQQSASGRFKIAIEDLKNTLLPMGESALNMFTKLIEKVRGFFETLNNLPGPIKSFLKIMGGISIVTGPIIMLVGLFANLMGQVTKGLVNLRTFGMALANVKNGVNPLTILGKKFNMVTEEMVAETNAAKIFGSTMEANVSPINAVTTAIEQLIIAMKELNVTSLTAATQKVQSSAAAMGAATGQVVYGVGKQPTRLHGTPKSNFPEKNVLYGPKTNGLGTGREAKYNAGVGVVDTRLASSGATLAANTYIGVKSGNTVVYKSEQAQMKYIEEQNALRQKLITHLQSQGFTESQIAIALEETFVGIETRLQDEAKSSVQRKRINFAVDKIANGTEQESIYNKQILNSILELKASYETEFKTLLANNASIEEQLSIQKEYELKLNEKLNLIKVGTSIENDIIAATEELLSQLEVQVAQGTDDVFYAETMDTLKKEEISYLDGISKLLASEYKLSIDGQKALNIWLRSLVQTATSQQEVAALTEVQSTEQLAINEAKEAELIAAREAAIIQEQSNQISRKGFLAKTKGAMTGGGLAMGVGMGASMAGGMMMGSSNQGVATAGQSLMWGGMVASMAPMLGMSGPVGLALGATVGLGIAIKHVIDEQQRMADGAKQGYAISNIAAQQFGITVRNLADVQIQHLIGKTSEANDVVSQMAAAYSKADGSTKNYIDSIKEMTSASDISSEMITKFYTDLTSGLNPEQAKKDIAAVLKAAGKEDYAFDISLKLNTLGGVNSPVEAFKKQLMSNSDINDTFKLIQERDNLIARGGGNRPGENSSAIQLQIDLLNASIQNSAGMLEKNADKIATSIQNAFNTMSVKDFKASLESIPDEIVNNSSAIQSFIDKMKETNPEFAAVIEDLHKQGAAWGSTLQAAQLYAEGTITSIEELKLAASNPVVLDFYINKHETTVEQKTTSDQTKSILSGIKPNSPTTGGGSGGSGGSGSKSTSAIDKQIEKNKELIDQIKKQQEERKKLIDLENRELDFAKTKMGLENQIRDALASGNFLKAAELQQELNVTQAKKDQEDTQKALDQADQDRIDALEKKNKELEKKKSKKSGGSGGSGSGSSTKNLGFTDESVQGALKEFAKNNTQMNLDQYLNSDAVKLYITQLQKLGYTYEDAQKIAKTFYTQQRRDTIAAVTDMETSNKQLVTALTSDADSFLSMSEDLKNTTVANIEGIMLNPAWSHTEKVEKLSEYLKKQLGMGPIEATKKAEEYLGLYDKPIGALQSLTKIENAYKSVGNAQRDALIKAQALEYMTNGTTNDEVTAIQMAKNRLAEKHAQGGLVGYKNGSPGAITGPGGPTGDKIPTMLSNGEYVIKASAVSKYGAAVMNSINDGTFNLSGISAPTFNLPQQASDISPNSSISNATINVDFNISGGDPKAIADEVMHKLQVTMKKSGSVNRF